jgi:tetratricopeptide (TPR) repeat protein
VELDADAPNFDRAYAMIEAQRLPEARAIWERALPQHASSASLHFNLALVCDALGDTRAAQQHFAQARKLSPATDRYRRAADAFSRRMQPKKNAPPNR